MASFSTISINFRANLKQFSTQMSNAQRDMQKFGKQMQSIGKGLTIGVTAPIVALGYKSVEAFDKQAKALAQVEAGVISTGKAAGYTAEQLQKMASDLQNNTIFGDEEILQGVTAQLLTFTNIAGNEFERTQQAALDLATRLDGDIKSAAIQLGKALNDPVANLSALSRSGIQFSKDQKATINALVETNNLAEAQTIILNELEKQYGGAAAAAAKAGTGSFKQLSNILGDITEEFGKIITEALIPFVKKIKEVALSFQNLDSETKKIIVVLGSLAAAIGPVLTVLGYLMTNIIPGLLPLFAKLNAIILANPWTALAAAIGIAAAAFIHFNKSSKEVTKYQTQMQEVTAKARKAIEEERAEVEKLFFVARDENVSKAQRIKAIKELNKISPKYLGNLNIEKINTDAARKAVDNYNESLLKTAKAKAAQEKLQQIQARIIEKELELSSRRKAIAEQEEQLRKGSADSAYMASVQETQLANAKSILAIETINATKALKEQEKAILAIIQANGGLTSSPNIVSTPSLENAEIQTPDTRQIAQNTNELSSYSFPSPLDQLEKRLPEQWELLKTQFAEIKEGMIDISSQVNNAINNLAAQSAEALGEFVGNIITGQASAKNALQGLLGLVGSFMNNLGQALIAAGVASEAFKNLFATGIGAIVAGTALIALSKVVSNILQSGVSGSSGVRTNGTGQNVTAFANGGIVSSPTLGLVGEYANARRNPEVIAPLDKLKGMIADVVPSGNSGGRLTAMVRGRDLMFVLDRQREYNDRLGS